MQGGTFVVRELLGDQVQQDFGVGLERQVEIGIGKDFRPQLGIIGQLPVEGEREPLELFDMPPLEGLSVAAVFLAAGGVTDVTDRGRAGISPHQRFKLGPMVEPKHLADGADVFPFDQELIAAGVKAGHSGGQLPPVLHVHEHAWDHPRDRIGTVSRDEPARFRVREMIHGGQAALVEEFRHNIPSWNGLDSHSGPVRRWKAGHSPRHRCRSALVPIISPRAVGTNALEADRFIWNGAHALSGERRCLRRRQQAHFQVQKSGAIPTTAIAAPENRKRDSPETVRSDNWPIAMPITCNAAVASTNPIA